MVRRDASNETRQRLLNRLGHFQQSRNGVNAKHHINPLVSQERRGSTSSLDSIGRIALRTATSFQQKLQDDTDTMTAAVAPTRDHETKQGGPSKVQFCQIVSGLEIPSRHQYSDRIKKTIWADRAEINAMVERNILEFEAEGFDWKNVVLDDDMYVDEANGELIHPCHYYDEHNDTGGLQDEKDSDDEPSFRPLQRYNSVI